MLVLHCLASYNYHKIFIIMKVFTFEQVNISLQKKFHCHASILLSNMSIIFLDNFQWLTNFKHTLQGHACIFFCEYSLTCISLSSKCFTCNTSIIFSCIFFTPKQVLSILCFLLLCKFCLACMFFILMPIFLLSCKFFILV